MQNSLAPPFQAHFQLFYNNITVSCSYTKDKATVTVTYY